MNIPKQKNIPPMPSPRKNDDIYLKRIELSNHYTDGYIFRRNTLLKYKDEKWVISTTGTNTTVFKPLYDNIDVTDISKQIDFSNYWCIRSEVWDKAIEKYGTLDEMHESMIEELIERIKNG